MLHIQYHRVEHGIQAYGTQSFVDHCYLSCRGSAALLFRSAQMHLNIDMPWTTEALVIKTVHPGVPGYLKII